jgi:Carboxypeptidase regulatory-like domain
LPARSISETKRVRYLLGLSSPAERQQIESEYFENEDAFEEMLTTEDDLIDAYARGELAGEERRRFEKSFLSSLRGRDQVQFARAFTGTVSAIRSVETKRPGPWLDIFKTFQSPGLLRTATIAVVIVFVAVLAWLVTDRRRMTNELSVLRAESAELSKRTEALQRNSDTERTRTSEASAQLTYLRGEPANSRHRARRTTTTQRARHWPEVKNDREKIASSKPEQTEKHINTQDASLSNASEKTSNTPILGRRFENLLTLQPGTSLDGHAARGRDDGATVRGTTKDSQGNVVSGATVTLTDSARNFTRTQLTNENGAYVFNAIPPGTYSLEVNATGFKTASASGLAALVDTPTVRDMHLEVGDVSETIYVTSSAEAAINTSDASLGNSFKGIPQLPLNAKNVVDLLSLEPGVSRTGAANGRRADQSSITLDGVETTIRIPSSPSWIRFQVALETAAIHEEYRVTIKTADGRPVTSVDWIEPLTPNQTIIDTPVIFTAELSSGNYVLLLMGKEPDGSFVKVAEYSFKVIKK